MKKCRRIRITAFRRRTTIVLRKLDGSRGTAGFCEEVKEPPAGADRSDHIAKATINKRRDDHESKSQNN